MIFETAGLIAFGSWLKGKLLDKGFDHLYDNLTKIDQEDKFYAIISKTGKQLQKKYPDVLGGSIDYFFKKEEVFEELVKLLFIDSKVEVKIIEENFDLQSLPENFVLEFVKKLKGNLLKDEDFSKILATKELYVNVLAISNSLKLIENNTSLTANEIKAIREILEEGQEKFDLEKFKSLYYKNAYNNLSQVNFIGLGLNSAIKKGRRKTIDDIFIKPNFELSAQYLESLDEKIQTRHKKNDNCIPQKDIFNYKKPLVILGNPGSGKSFLIKSIICSIIKNKRSTFKNKEVYTRIPFRVELRKYLALKKESRGNILEYLIKLLESEYGIPEISERSFEQICEKEKTLFFFDGFDEIFNVNDRIEIKNDIENFQTRFGNSLTVTTSRIIGYEEAKLNPDNFVEWRILDFNDEQISEYVRKWYKIEESRLDVRKGEVDDFLSKKDQLDKELIHNPLLLSLIVILFRNNLKLPDSKLEIYQSCASTLVDKWDASKKLDIELDEEVAKRKEAVLANLAYWQYEQMTKKKGKITYQGAKNEVASTILNKLKLKDEYVIDRVAEDFMTYAEKRSIYFDNNFTHKTFLEYYTAYWIYTNLERKHKIKERDELISRYIDNQFWHIVLELLLNLIDKDQADNEIIDELIISQVKRSKSSLLFFLNTLNSLKNVSQGVVINVIKSSFLCLVEGGKFRSYGKISRANDQKLSLYEGIKFFLNRRNLFLIKKSIAGININDLSEDERFNIAFVYIEMFVGLSFYFKESEDLKDIFLEEWFYKTYHVEIDNSPLLFYLYYHIIKGRKITFSFLKEYFDRFKDQVILKDVDLFFEPIFFFNLFDKYILRLFSEQGKISNLEEEIRKIIEIGVSEKILARRIFHCSSRLVFKDFDQGSSQNIKLLQLSEENEFLKPYIYAKILGELELNKAELIDEIYRYNPQSSVLVLLQKKNSTKFREDFFTLLFEEFS